ncbi:MAG TPA: hypothetical protein GX710_05205 [Clostridiales bacterium]|nr:hypothetical protein [Clostridiales bacterium]
MNSVYDLLERLQEILKGADGQNVFNEYQQTLIEEQNQDLYVTIGIKEVTSDSPYQTPLSRVYSSKVVFSVNIVCDIKKSYQDIYAYFDAIILDRLLNLVYADKIYTKPLEFNPKLNKLQLYSEFTINSSMIFHS